MTLRRYLKRRAELDPDPAARLIVDPDGKPAPIERIDAEIIANLLLWLGPDRLCFGSYYAIWSLRWLIDKFIAFELPV